MARMFLPRARRSTLELLLTADGSQALEFAVPARAARATHLAPLLQAPLT